MMHPMKRTISVLKFIGLIGLVAASFSFAMFQGGFVSWFLFGSFLPIAFYSILLNFYPIKRISIKRVLDKTEYVNGEMVSVKIHITLPYRIPLVYLFIKDEVSERSGVVRFQEQRYHFRYFQKNERLLTTTIYCHVGSTPFTRYESKWVICWA